MRSSETIGATSSTETHRRDVVHRDAGYEVIRFTGRQLEREPFYVVAVIARALDRRSRVHG